MGNNCCNTSNDEPAYMNGRNEGGSSSEFMRFSKAPTKLRIGAPGSHEDIKNFISKYDVITLVFNTKGGLYESYHCMKKRKRSSEGGPSK